MAVSSKTVVGVVGVTTAAAGLLMAAPAAAAPPSADDGREAAEAVQASSWAGAGNVSQSFNTTGVPQVAITAPVPAVSTNSEDGDGVPAGT